MKNNQLLFPPEQKILKQMGRNFKLARLRRNYAMSLICERASVSRATLWKIENGDPSVSIGNYINVAHAIGGFDEDFLKICSDDYLGKTLTELGIMNKNRGKR